MTTQVDLTVNLSLTPEQFQEVYESLVHRTAQVLTEKHEHMNNEEMDEASDLDLVRENLAQVLDHMDTLNPFLTD